MFEGFVALLAIAVSLYGMFDVLLSRPSSLRRLARVVWLPIVVLVPLLGAIAWWLYGRPADAGRFPGNRSAAGSPLVGPAMRSVPVVRGPEDDPEFIRALEERVRRQREL